MESLNSGPEIREPGAARVAMRGDLVFRQEQFAGQACYVIEDPLRAKFFRLGRPEFELISALDGHSTIEAAVAAAAKRLGPEAISLADALTLCRWLVDNQLARTLESGRGERLALAAKRNARARLQAWLNPLAIKLPLVNPDRLLDRVAPRCQWLFTWQMATVWIAVVCWGLVCVLGNWSRLVSSASLIFDPHNWLRMLLVWTGLKLAHEAGHAITCKKFGGAVSRAGMMLILFTPVAFVDVTTAWRFPSKWQRAATAAAGVIVELFVAAAALIAWSHCGPGLTQRLLYDLALTASVGTLLFNANPLMRFDGYFLLSDLMEVPNLHAISRQWLRTFFERNLLGLDVVSPELPAGKAGFIKCYGVLAMLWRLLMSVLIGLMLLRSFPLAGPPLVVLLLLAGLVLPAIGLVKRVRQSSLNAASRRRRRRAVVCMAAGMLLAGVLLTRPGVITAPAVVEYAPLTIIRAESPGFVKSIDVCDGQWIDAGQVLVRLENRALTAAAEDLALAIEQSVVKSRLYQQGGELAKQQIEDGNRLALTKKLAEAARQETELTVRSPVAGRVISRNLETLERRYLKPGVQIAVIGSESAKELLVTIAEHEFDAFTSQLNQNVEVQGADRLKRTGKLEKLDPRASLAVPHPALSARAGGPLPIKLGKAAGEDPNSLKQACELVEPRFRASVALGSAAGELSPGELALVRFTAPGETVGGRWGRAIYRWVRQETSEHAAK